MTVCFFGTYYPNYSRNSILMDGLKACGVKVIQAHRTVAKTSMEYKEDFTWWKSLQRIFKKFQTSLSLLTEYRKVKDCDLVLVPFPGHLDIPLAWLLTRIFGKPLVFDAGMSLYDIMIIDKDMAESNSFKAQTLKFSERLLLKLADYLLVDTEEMKQFIHTTFSVNQNKILVAPIGANENLYTPGQTRKRATTEVFFFGLYNPLQGTPFIIKAAKLLQADSSIRITMLGDGAEKQDVLDYAQKHNLKNVKFVNFVPEIELVRYIQKADIMLGIFGDRPIAKRVIANKVYAGLGCAKPIITAEAPAVTRFLKHKQHVYLCKVADPKSLADAIKTVSLDKKLQKKLSTQGYQIYQQLFTTQKVGQLVYNLFSEVLS